MITNAEPSSSLPKKRLMVRPMLYTLLIVCAVVFAAVMFIPVLDGPQRRQHANEASAVGGLRTISTLQTEYSVAHPERGFACDLPLLKPAGPSGDPVYGPNAFFVTGTKSGYKFALGSCNTDAQARVVHYQVTAVPVENRVTGFRAFCSDESGLIWYDKAGSATNCLASRRLLE